MGAQDKSATVMKQPKLPPADGSTDEGHGTRELIRTDSSIESNKQKTQIAKVKLDTAVVKRSIAREALDNEGKDIPKNLKKGGLDATKENLAKAMAKATAKADAMEQDEGIPLKNEGIPRELLQQEVKLDT